MTRLLLTLIAVILTGTLPTRAGDIKAIRNRVDNGYNFWLATPAGTQGEGAEMKPVVVFLHGASLKGTDLNRVLRYGSVDAVKRGLSLDAYVIAPQTTTWWIPEKVINTVDWVLDNYPDADPERVYVLGMSLGGYGTMDVAATYPDRIAAAIAMCGGATVRDLSGLQQLPFWVVHGTSDRAVSVRESDRVVNYLQDLPTGAPRLTYDRMNGWNHGRPARLFYIPEVYEWLFAHSLHDRNREMRPTVELTPMIVNNAYRSLRDRHDIITPPEDEGSDFFLPAGFDASDLEFIYGEQ